MHTLPFWISFPAAAVIQSCYSCCHYLLGLGLHMHWDCHLCELEPHLGSPFGYACSYGSCCFLLLLSPTELGVHVHWGCPLGFCFRLVLFSSWLPFGLHIHILSRCCCCCWSPARLADTTLSLVRRDGAKSTERVTHAEVICAHVHCTCA